jgi:hypothetical protein
MKHLTFPAAECNTSDAFHCGGEEPPCEQLFKKKLGGVSSISNFLHGKGPAR